MSDSPEQHERPSARQLLHAVTGDRDAEADALADRSPDDVDHDDAATAVRRAHGDIDADTEPPSNRDLATPDDAEAAHEERHPG